MGSTRMPFFLSLCLISLGFTIQLVSPFTSCSFDALVSTNLLPGNVEINYWDPEGGDCRPYHGVTLFDCAYIESPAITIDGINDEPAWTQGNNNTRRIPTACMNESVTFFKSYINFTAFRDDTYIYFLLRWNDSTPTGLASRQDEVDLCWNINMKDFSAYFALGMQTMTPGERVDSFGWNKLDFPNGTVNPGKDQCFGSDGWYDRTDETQDITTGYTLLNISSTYYYQVEFRRKLSTDDDYDVQFDKNGFYEVNFAVINDLGHEDHAVSWNYAIKITGLPESSDWIVAWVVGLSAILGIVGTAHLVKKRNQKRRV